MSALKLTVGIPTFNRAELLKEAIKSVLAQDYTDFRLIVSDNASADHTPEVVRSFADERIDYIRSERNIGALANFSRLIGLADTEFLMLLPDDDILYPGHLGAAVEALERFDTAGLVHTAFDVIDSDSRVLHRIEPLVSHSSVTIERGDRVLERMMVSRWPICFPSVVYRTNAIVRAGGLREQDEPFSDLPLWMRMTLDWDFAYVAKPLAGFRVHPESWTQRIGAEQGADDDGPGLVALHAQTRFDVRMSFLDAAPLQPQRTKWFRALATLEFLVERARLGMPRHEVAASLVNLVQTFPRVLMRPGLWRFVLAQLGAGRVRSALRAAMRSRPQVRGTPAR